MIKRQIKIIKLKTVDSTNTYLRALAEEGECEGCIVVADTQTAGRGRRGKSFYSPKASGLYMSILVRPEFSIEDSLFITSMTAVATARAIQRVSGKDCGIKWVNDIFLDGKKVAGILCEASYDHPNDRVNYAVVGIGINLSPPDTLPEELTHIFTSLDMQGIRDELITAVTEEFFSLYDTLPSADFLEEYRRKSVILGKRISVISDECWECTAIEIDDNCRLIVKKDSGETVTLSSGEVSTKCAK